jgi:hypothetical protein
MTTPLRWAFFVRRQEPGSAELVKALLDGLGSVPGVARLDWYEAREVPQPADVRRSLNEVHGLGTVDFDDDAVPRRIEQLVLAVEGSAGSIGPNRALIRGMFTTARPEYDLLRDTPPRHVPYLQLPVEWKTSRAVPAEATDDDLWRYVYFFRYKPEVAWDTGEEWYVGHHTREGKQLPGLRRYETWARALWPGRRLARAEQLNGSIRYTELCFGSFEDWHRACYSHGPRWRTAADYPDGVWEDYHAFFVGPTPTHTLRPTT